MHKSLLAFAVLFAFGLSCSSVCAEGTNTPLTFYIVSGQKSESMVYFDSFPFPKLGYIASKPDLVVTHLKTAVLDERPAISGFADNRETGEMRRATIYGGLRLCFELLDEDVSKLRALVHSSREQRLLILFREKPLCLKRLDDSFSESQFSVRQHSIDQTELRMIANELAKLRVEMR